MAGIDAYAVALFEQSKAFLEAAQSASSTEAEQAFLNAALLLGTAALEAHINALSEEMLIRPGLSILEQSLLSEKDYSLERGEFVPKNRLKMYRLEDRLQFLFKRFTKLQNPTSETWWAPVATLVDLRNKVVHAKASPTLNASTVERGLQAILECLNDLYKGLFRKGYPGLGRGLDSSITLHLA
jgi:hypothetical protein